MKAFGRVLSASHLAPISVRLAPVAIALATLLMAVSAFLVPGPRPVAAEDELRDPREIATTDDEAGKRVTVEADEDGSDDISRWTHRRWSRDRESSDFHVGPVLIDNKVWVATNLDTARAIYKTQVDKMREFPERDVNQDSAKGPFAFQVKEGQKPSDLAEDAAALSACVDCDVKTVILTHRRIVLRRLNVVTVMYIFGRENVATPELAVWYAWQISQRMI